MYNEFIELSGFDESYITYQDYADYIEPAYLVSRYISKEYFVKAFYNAFSKKVNEPISLMLSALTLEEKEKYVFEKDQSIVKDIDKANQLLKIGFLKNLKRGEIKI